MKIDFKNLGLFLMVVVTVLLIYGPWFSSEIIARGDWKGGSSGWMLEYFGAPSIWLRAVGGGSSALSGAGLASFPLWSLQANLHQLLGIGFEWTERIIWFFPFLIFSTLSIFLLSRYLFKDTSVSFFATIYFLANNFIVFRMHTAQISLGMAYALTPLSLYFFIRGLEERKWHFVFFNGIVLSLVSYYDFRIVPLILLVQVLYGLYHAFVLTSSTERFRGVSTVFGGILAVSVFLLFSNIFWLLPLTFDFQSSLSAIPSVSSEATIKNLSRTGFFDALLLSIGSNSKLGGFVYLDRQIVNEVLFLFFPIIYIAPFLAKRKKGLYFWVMISVISAFFAKGLNPPFPSINEAFYTHIPLTSMYRLPEKFLIVGGTAISLCFGLGCSAILKRIKENSEVYLGGFLVLSFLPLLVIYPALFGPSSLKAMAGGSSFRPFVPATYFQNEEWLGRQESGYKSIVLPGTPSYYFFNEASPLYRPMTDVALNTSFGSFYTRKFETLGGLESLSKEAELNEMVLPAALRLMGIKYIFLAPADDTLWAWYLEGVRDQFVRGLSQITTLERTEQENVWQIPAPLPNIFVSRRLLSVEGEFEQELVALLDAGVGLRNVTLVEGEIAGAISSEELEIDGFDNGPVEVIVEKVGNARYKVKISDPPQGRFYLNFLDGYDLNWMLNGETESRLSALGANYFPLENKNGSSILELTLEHRLQKYLDIGWRTTQFFWLIVIVGLVGYLIRSRRAPTVRELSQRVWGAEYRKLLQENRLEFVDKYARADLELIRRHIKVGPGTRFLEIGCGRGRVSAMLSGLGVDVVGLDISPEAIALARKIFERYNLKGSFVCGDVENLPFKDETFDLVFGGGVLEHTEDTPRAFGKVFRVLRRGGKLITTIPCLSVTTLFQGLLTGSIPQIPVVKQMYLLIHQTLFGCRYMRYGFEKLYTLGNIERLARGVGFRHVTVKPYFPGYDFKFIPTVVLKKLAIRLVRLQGFWPMVELVAEK